MKPVCGVVTKGLNDGGDDQYVSLYVIKTSLDGRKFRALRQKNGKEREFAGNSNGTEERENRFDPEYARYVRLQIKRCTDHPALKLDVLCASMYTYIHMIKYSHVCVDLFTTYLQNIYRKPYTCINICLPGMYNVHVHVHE